MTLIKIFIGIVIILFVCYALCKASAMGGKKQDEINRLEYQKRLDMKGGDK